MRIVLDLQACQSRGSRSRGIGRYSLALAKAMLDVEKHDFWVALNTAFPDTVASLREELKGAISQQRIIEWGVPCPTATCNAANTWRASSGASISEAFMERLRPDFVHVSSLFEGFGDDVVASVPTNDAYPVAVTLYDLIPLAHRNIYLPDVNERNFYYDRVDALKRARLLLAISDSTRNDAIELLGISPDHIFNISGAVDDIFRPTPICKSTEEALRTRLGISRRFVMYTGGIDHRKNIEGLIRAYAALTQEVRGTHQLAVVCRVGNADRGRLLDLARSHGLAEDEVVLTGFVKDADLVALYNLCDLFVFPSWYEGFGLPALEAMSCGAPVIASNTSSIPEVVGRADALFDPHKDQSISALMMKVLQDDAFRQVLKEHGLVRSKRFSWNESARRALAAMEAVHGVRRSARRIVGSSDWNTKPRLAYVSPLPPERTGIADYSAELLPKLAEHYDIELISDQAEIEGAIPPRWPWRSYEWFDSHANHYDRVLYQFGNSPFHGRMFDQLSRHPGTVVLHDFFLGYIARHLQYNEAQPHFWERALYASHGYPALVDLRNATYPATDVALKYPCSWDVFFHADGVIMHSDFSVSLAGNWYGQSVASRIARVPLLRQLRSEIPRDRARRALGLPERAFITVSLGIVDPIKLCHRLVKAWAESGISNSPDNLLVFVGASYDQAYTEALHEQIDALGLSGRCRITGFVEREKFEAYIAAADVVVQLRTQSRGETSAAILDGLAFGRPVIVNAHGSASEFPDTCVRKVSDRFSDAELSQALDSLWGDEAGRGELAARGRAYLADVHDPERIAESYRSAIESFYSSSQHRRLRDRWRDIKGRVGGVVPEPGDLERAAESLAEAIPADVAQRQLCVDVSQLMAAGENEPHRQLVEQALSELLSTSSGSNIRIEPVYAALGATGGVYRYARAFTAGFLGLPDPPGSDDLLDVSEGDVFLGFDFLRYIKLHCERYLREMQRRGMKVAFLAHDDARDVSALVAALCHWRDRGCDGKPSGLIQLDPATWRENVERLSEAIGSMQPMLRRRALAGPRHYLSGGDVRLQTLCGRRSDGVLMTTAQAGALVYGPYLRLARGSYEMNLYGTIEDAAGAHFDVVSDHGTKTFLEGDLKDSTSSGADGSLLFSRSFALDHDVEDLEVRVHVGAATVMCVRAVEILADCRTAARVEAA